MNINNFPIPDLPTSMLNHVLNKLLTMDLIHYSTSSESCKSNVQSMLTRREVKLEISVENCLVVLRHSFPETDERDCTIHINSINDIHEDSIFMSVKTTMNFNGKSVFANVRDHKNLTVYWETKIDGLIFMLDYLTELFLHMPICDLRTGGPIEDMERVLEWIKKQEKPEVERCSLCPSNTAEDVSNILDNVTITTVLEIFTKLPEDFKYELPQNLKLFGCAHARWISREQLLRMNYEQIDLRETKFQNKDISDLVNKIMNGDFPAIRFCNIVLVSPSIEEIVRGINFERTPSQLRCYLKPTKYGRHSFNVFGVYDYERADGEIVSICSGFPDSITRNIMIFVRSKTEPLERFD